MTNGERSLAMLQGKPVDRIPFTAYENKVQFGPDERKLRNDGMCIVFRQPNFFSFISAKGRLRREIGVTPEGLREEKIFYETEGGTLIAREIDRGEGHNNWKEELFFKTEKDYPLLISFLEDIDFKDQCGAVGKSLAMADGDCIPRGKLDYSPMHYLIYNIFGIYEFSMQWNDNKKRVLELYEILREKRRILYPLAARSPQPLINICGNVSANVISPEMFRKYYIPEYNEAAEALHAAGKLVGVHFDGITAPYADLIRDSALDYIEALTPPPDCDVTVSQAFDFWPEKTIWINFPSSVQMGTPEEIRKTIQGMLGEYRPGRRFLVGITEDVPADKWPISFRILLDEINAFRLN